MTRDLLDDLEEDIEMLKVAYERYFNGVDRVPPARQHDTVKRQVRNLERIRSASTQLRYRAQGLKARLITYEQYWNRILRQIEKGTFKRVLAESSKREREFQIQRAARQAESAQAAQSGVLAKVDESEQSGVLPRRKPARPQPSARPQLPDGMDSKSARQLFKQFIAAKKAAGEPVKGLTYGKLVNKLASEIPKLQQKHGTTIRFEVATVNGKVRLRARKGAQS